MARAGGSSIASPSVRMFQTNGQVTSSRSIVRVYTPLENQARPLYGSDEAPVKRRWRGVAYSSYVRDFGRVIGSELLHYRPAQAATRLTVETVVRGEP